jgi:long-chain acyl-CoA synthetase
MAFVGDRLEAFAETAPEQAALSCGPARYTRNRLLDEIKGLERNIRRRTPRGGRIALCVTDPAALLLWVMACARSGRFAMVLDPAWPEEQVRSILDATAPVLVIDDLNIAETAGEGGATTSDEPPPGEDDLFYAGFTSGSSGTPKGFIRSHGSWLESFRLTDRAFGIAPESRIVLPGRLTHSLHLYGAVCGLAAGQEVVLVPRFEPRAVLLELARADGGAVLYATPTQLHFLAEAARRGGPVDTVAQVLASGAKWHDGDRALLRKVFPQARLFEFYGASETSFITIAGDEIAGDDLPVPPGSVGRPAEGVEIAIGTPDEPLAPGETGPVWVRSGLLFSGYICGAAPETRRSAGWLTVGDHGYLDKDGFLFLTGRENRMVVTSGLNVYPEEIERVLCEHPAVAAAVVAGLPDPVRGERLEAVVVLAGPLADAEAVLLRACREMLAPGKQPRKIHLRSSLPLTSGGKPDIRKILADLQAGEAGP